MIELNSKQMSNPEIIEMLRSTRDKQISRLLTEQGFMSFLEEHYGTFVISALKKQYLYRDLRELQGSSLDLVHYSQLIRQVKETGEVRAIDSSVLFHAELDRLFRKQGIGG